MKVVQTRWSAKKFCDNRNRINSNPAWQRGPAWKPPRQVLLIDSILRGMDIPKVYLRRLSPKITFDYEAVDGQQRLRAIWAFRAGSLKLNYPESLPPIDGYPVAGLAFKELHRDLREKFDHFIVSVAEIVSATNDEITSLFARLQMGVSLNPAELRNAMVMRPLRHVIDALARSHEFFVDCRIPESRYKRQDYVTHIFAIAANRGKKDIKAADLKRLVESFGQSDANRILEMSAEVGDALGVLASVNKFVSYRITQKWIFVDLCWLIMQRQSAGVAVDPAKLATAYLNFEQRRRTHNSNPDVLIRSKRKDPTLDRHLYNYIVAFRSQGGLASNVGIRNAALKAFCPDIDRRD